MRPCRLTLFVSVRTTRHAVQWLEDFRRVIADIAEIVEAWRLTGQVDYLLRIVVPDVDAYDAVYKRLIKQLEFADISSAIAMEELKFTTAVPTNYLLR
jgi:Lrp/AsnC family transcriptional regulator